MGKTVNTLNVGDKVYFPRVDDIIERKVEGIIKSAEGIKVGIGKYSYGTDEADYSAAISTKIKYTKRNETYYLRLEDAVKEQKKLQVLRLKSLQQTADHALSELNEFTLKYFTDDNS